MHENLIVKRCQRGEKQAFEELIRLYYDYVFRFLLKVSGNQSAAEDLTQETFLKMILSIEKFDLGGSASFGTWLIAIAKNQYIDFLRKNHVYLQELPLHALSDAGDLAESVAQKMQYEQILQAIETLPPEQGLAIRLKYEEGMTLAQIAERFKTEPKTIKSRIHDGKVKLRKIMNRRERTEKI